MCFPLSKRYKNNAIEVAMLNYISTVDKVFGLSDPYAKVVPSEKGNEMDKVTMTANAASHRIGNIDGVARCVDCEIASWNAWKQECVA
jgi:hypothetical protein